MNLYKLKLYYIANNFIIRHNYRLYTFVIHKILNHFSYADRLFPLVYGNKRTSFQYLYHQYIEVAKFK